MCEVNIETLKEKTIQGDIDSMNELARCYAMGIGVDIDYNMALMYLQQAANLGNPLAMANLAIFYAQGICKDRDIKKALDLFHKAACQGANIRETVFQYIDKRVLHSLALEGCSSAEYYYALTLGNDEEAKRDALILSASNKKLALATGALAFKRFLANPTRSNFEAKKLFQQAVDNGYDYFQMLNQIALTVQQVDLENKFSICDIVRSFIEEKYERPFILVKITSKKWAEKLVNNGEVFFRSLGAFREISKPGVGDVYEGVANTAGKLPFWNEIEQEALSEMIEVGMYDECMSHEKIYCLYALEYSEDGNIIPPDIRMRQFGDSAVVIWDGLEFCRRLESALNKKYGNSIWLGHHRVNYNVVFSKSRMYTEFSKTEPYAWQNEYRFIFDIANGRVEKTEWDNMTDFAKLMYLNSGDKIDFFEDSDSDVVSIGDISDIGTMYPIDDFINLNNITIKKGTPYRIDNSSSEHNHHAAYAYRPFIKL
jgi:hypothetical protein